MSFHISTGGVCRFLKSGGTIAWYPAQAHSRCPKNFHERIKESELSHVKVRFLPHRNYGRLTLTLQVGGYLRPFTVLDMFVNMFQGMWLGPHLYL